jgi:hypothetical protein
MSTENVINNHIDSDKKEQPERQLPPNESTGIYVRGFVKITDPESGQVYIETAN